MHSNGTGLLALPPDHLAQFERIVRASPPCLGYEWLAGMLAWEARRRTGTPSGDMPHHNLAPEQLSDAIGFLWGFAGRIRANPDGRRLGPIVDVLDAAVAQLTAEMRQ